MFPNTIKKIPGNHKGKKIIWLQFPYDISLINQVKSIKAYWSQTAKCWYVSDNAYYRNLLGLEQRWMGKQALHNIADINQPALTAMLQHLKLKAYSPSTIRTYLTEFAQLLYVLKDRDVNLLTTQQLQSYCLYCIDTIGISEHQMHSRINALKFYFEQVAGWTEFSTMIPRPKKPSLLPKVLSQQEINALFKVVKNKKHLLMLQLCYGMGLRVSEVVNLKLSDIDSNRMQVLIARSKGKKDRYVHLPESILTSLKDYCANYRPTYYLFEGALGGQYAVRSVQQVFKNAMKSAKIDKPIGIHGLRHSYATHLLEYGTDIAYIQKLMGHKDVKTTLVYTKVSNASLQKIKSPLDRMNQGKEENG